MSRINNGKVYILANEYHKDNVYKIGKSINSIRRRKQLSRQTASPGDFEIIFEREFADPYKIEQQILNHFDKYRTKKNKEFLVMPLQELVLYVDDIYIEETKHKLIALDKELTEIDSRYQTLLDDSTSENYFIIKQNSLYKKFIDLLTDKDKLITFWNNLPIHVKLLFINRVPLKIGNYVTYLSKKELVSKLSRLLLIEMVADKIQEKVDEMNPFDIRLSEKNIINISKVLFPFFRKYYTEEYYPIITGKNNFLVENIGFHSIYSFLFIKEFKIENPKPLKYLIYFINIEYLILDFFLDETILETIKILPNLKDIELSIKSNQLHLLKKMDKYHKIKVICTFSKYEMEDIEKIKEQIISYLPNHHFYYSIEKLKFNRERWTMFFDLYGYSQKNET